jgi:triosephosphate isomerase (TIM)
MTRRPAIVGNWKLWGTRAQAREYCERLLTLLPDERRRPAAVGIAAPFTALEVCVEQLAGSGVGVYAQNMHQEESGAFTGEVSAPMLVELGVNGVVLGHSERRQYNGETDRALQDKVPAALAAGLRPILCVGESEEEREGGETERKLRHQVQEGLEKVPVERLADVVVAYEPVWAIGTGQTATPAQAAEVHGQLRAGLARLAGSAVAAACPILYGGSVKVEVTSALLSQPDIDGALVGGASLKAADFVGIVRAGLEARGRS